MSNLMTATQIARLNGTDAGILGSTFPLAAEIKLGTMLQYLDMTTGRYTGEIDLTVAGAVRIAGGAWTGEAANDAALLVGTFHSTTAGSGVELEPTATYPVTAGARIYTDDGGDSLAFTGSVGDLRSVLGRMLITASQASINTRLFGVQGQLKSYRAAWDNEVHAGAQGLAELIGNSTTFGGYGVTAGTIGQLSTSGTVTIGANHILAGVAALSNMMGTVTQTGHSCGVYVGVYDTTNWSDATARAAWKYGLFVDTSAATNGLYIGTCTTGITIAGTVTTGITLSGAALTTDLILHDGCTIHNTDANTVTITEAVVACSAKLTADNIDIGGGYTGGGSGATISTAGVGQFNGALTTDGALTADNIVCTNAATFGGGYASSGVTISTAGLIQSAGGLIISPNTCTAPIKVGAWVSNTAGTVYGQSLNGAATDGSFNYAIGAFCDDGGAAMTADISSPAVFRYLVTVNQTGGKTQTALHSHLKVAGDGGGGGTRAFTTGGLRGAYIFNQLGTITLSGDAELVGINQATTLAGTMTVGATNIWGGVDINIAGAGTASVTTGGIAAGLIIRSKTAEAALWPIGIYMNRGVTQPIRIGDWAGSGAAGSAIPISAVTDPADTTQRNLVACYGESTTDLGSDIHANVGRFRHLVSTGVASTDINHETYGLVGQVCAKSVELKHMHSGLMGTFEGTGAGVIANGAYDYSVAAVIGRIGGGANIVATKPIAGVASILNGADVASGSIAAFASSATSTGNWTWGLVLGDCDEAFNFLTTGACVDAAHSVGTITSGKQILISIDGSPFAMAVYAVGTS